MKRVALWLAAVGMVVSSATYTFADEPETASLKADIEVLKQRLNQLERQLSQVPSGSGSTSMGDKAGLPTLTLPSGLQGVTISGYVDTSYEFNFNRPATPAGGNKGRVFDINSNSFTPHVAKLAFEKTASDASPVGFRTDLMYGDDAELIHSTGLGAAGTDSFDLEQAYVTYHAPIGNGLDLKAGKFVTLLGAEVIESPSNWNFSRSYLFGFAIPFTHTGALATYSLGEWGSTTWGLVNGWDLVDETNSFKTILGNLTLTPIQGVTLATNLITGAELGTNNRDDRTVLDLVATWQPTDKLTLMANYDNGHQSNVVHRTSTGAKGSDSANWSGVALYAKYDLTDTWALAGRWEMFNDADGARTGLTAFDGVGVDGVRLSEYTLTSQWKLHEHLLARLEYRHDISTEKVFLENSGFANSQDTVAAEVVYHF